MGLDDSFSGQSRKDQLKWMLQIDAICDEFESAWKQDRTPLPLIEDFVARIDVAVQPKLFCELLFVETQARKHRQLQPWNAGEFQKRFPKYTEQIAWVLKALQDGSVDQSQNRKNDATGEQTLAMPSPKNSDAPAVIKNTHGDGSRFQILRPHAQGGLGKVSVANDIELNREVALKEILSQYADDADSRGRFVLEAEVTGGLEHPGIVPVYGLGQYEDGRPYYAMRFIRGNSLKGAVDRYHKEGSAEETGGETEHNLELRNLLGRFIDVCNAM